MKAFAYTDKESGISVRTVSDSRVGAMVNALMVFKDIHVTADWLDEEIIDCFNRKAKPYEKIIEVEVIRKIRAHG